MDFISQNHANTYRHLSCDCMSLLSSEESMTSMEETVMEPFFDFFLANSTDKNDACFIHDGFGMSIDSDGFGRTFLWEGSVVSGGRESLNNYIDSYARSNP